MPGLGTHAPTCTWTASPLCVSACGDSDVLHPGSGTGGQQESNTAANAANASNTSNGANKKEDNVEKARAPRKGSPLPVAAVA